MELNVLGVALGDEPAVGLTWFLQWYDSLCQRTQKTLRAHLNIDGLILHNNIHKTLNYIVIHCRFLMFLHSVFPPVKHA